MYVVPPEKVYLKCMNRVILILSFVFGLNFCVKAGGDTIIYITDLENCIPRPGQEQGMLVGGLWKFKSGDQEIWAERNFNDSLWISINPDLDTLQSAPGLFGGIGWFRTKIRVDDAYAGVPLGLMVTQSGASDIYIDGKLVHSFGIINTTNPDEEHRYDPQFVPIGVIFDTGGVHTIAVRYANSRAEKDVVSGASNAPGFDIMIGPLSENIKAKYVNSNIVTGIFVFYFTFFLALSLLHFVIWLYYRANRSNLYYSIFAASFGIIFLTLMATQNVTSPDIEIVAGRTNDILSCVYAPALIAMMYSIFYGRLIKIFWLLVAIYAVELFLFMINAQTQWLTLGTFLIFSVESLRVIIAAIYNKREGAWIIGSGVLVTVVFLVTFVLLSITGQSQFVYKSGGYLVALLGIVFMYMTLSIPIHISIYLARDFARTSKNLEKKLVEVAQLSEQTVRQEKEKQHILERQKETLEQQVQERTLEIVQQKKVIEEKNKDITDSIHYARKIQESMLPAAELVKQLFPENFVLYRPKDIVSGDFYWVAESGGYRYIAAVDCTGHGVPGALMSMTGNNFLNQIVLERNISQPREILEQLNSEVRKSLRQDQAETESKDGMDIALCRFDSNLQTLTYAGANRPLWLIRDKQLIEYKPVKQSIGGMDLDMDFTEQTISLSKGDMLYIFSDGYADQFGGPEGKKFMSRKLKDLLFSICHMTIDQQCDELERVLIDWRGELTQVDDILVMGIRI